MPFSIHRFVCSPFVSIIVLTANAFALTAVADDSISRDDVFNAWRARQSAIETVDCTADVLVHYFKESQFVAGEDQWQPTHGRSGKQTVTLQLDGPAKFRIHHLGNQWHRRFARMLPFDWARFSNGNQYISLERPYKEIPNWTPKPRVSVLPKADLQQFGWDDQTLTPLLMHFRPFNIRHCPFVVTDQWHVAGSQKIGQFNCVSLQPVAAKSGFSIHQYRYWVSPEQDMAVVQIQRFTNGRLEWQYDIDYQQGPHGTQPVSYQAKRFRDDRLLEFAKVRVNQLILNKAIDPAVFELETYQTP